MDQEYERLRSRLAPHGQGHVLRWWPDLSGEQRRRLASQLESIDFPRLERLFQDEEGIPVPRAEEIRPAPIIRLPASFEDWEREQQAAEVGEQALEAGQVAILMVAGGQGTRLGFAGPKGAFPIGPISGKSLFQWHAEKVLALARRHKAPLPFYIMTSPENDEATRQFFADHGHFGLDPAEVVFFVQGMMPALDRRSGKLLLAGRDTLAMSPNGHGGTLQALADAGHLDRLARRGIRHLFYFQVDNPLVKIADPVYLGQHILAGAEASLKVVAKAGPREKVGNLVEVAGRLQVIEYSDLPDELADRRTPDGSLEVWAGSIAIHVFDVPFLKRLASGASILPFHRAVKKAPYLNEEGEIVNPAEPNAVKFEMFIFDSIPLAARALAVETSRAEEFEPVKNADGENSPATAKQALGNLFAGWLNRAGVEVARGSDQSAAVPLEISPLFALDAEELRDRLSIEGPVTEPFLLEAVTEDRGLQTTNEGPVS
jgi:UDP-N-acetylglucosamine/UDP-N-acetylgalactosamine diphosphorylase